jgi:carotenoid cleavage dioxygenase-like enzyme
MMIGQFLWFSFFAAAAWSMSYPVLRNGKGLFGLNGFFGMVGPNLHVDKSTPMFELFKGDGIVQGVFFENGTIYPVKHIIQTEKVLFKNKYVCSQASEFKSKFRKFVRDVLKNTIALPNMLGSANTALLTVKNKTYALFEQDVPYEIGVDFENRNITTVGKVVLGGVHKHVGPYRFSGHTKYDAENDLIHTIDYNIFTRIVTYYKMNTNFTILYMFAKQMDYIPIIHDFYVLRTGDIMVIDSPFKLWPFLKRDFCNPRTLLHHVPIVLRKDLPTNIHILGRSPAKFAVDAGFYCFHFGQVFETEDTIRICASLYDEFDFNSLNINGKYREIVIKKKYGSCYLRTSPILETMNLDFPVMYGESAILQPVVLRRIVLRRIVLRRIVDGRIAGFVICNGLEIERVIDLPDSVSIFGEHIVKEIDGSVYIMAFSKDGSLVVVNTEKDNDVTVIPVFEDGVTLGFHSIFREL